MTQNSQAWTGWTVWTKSSAARHLLVCCVVLAAAGCRTVGPIYVAPQPDVDSVWAGESTEVEGLFNSFDPKSLERWWHRFDDPTLDRLVEQALSRNLNVREAAARVAEARALRDWTVGRELPYVSVGGGVAERRQSENGPLPIDRIPGLERDQTIFDAGFDASWELDLFGRTQHAVDGAEARLESAAERHRAAQFSLAAEITRNYLALMETQRRLASLGAAASSVRETHGLVKLRHEAGDIAALEVARAETVLRRAEAKLPSVEAEAKSLALGLGVLAGGAPGSELALLDEMPKTLELAAFPLGERADLLRRRPDIRAAERQLAAATADIGLAIAELYPRLSIGARGGFQSLEAESLLDSASMTWSIMPAISWRIFDGGRVQAEIRLAEARADIAAVAWERAVQGALLDAERALVRYLGALAALDVQREAIRAAGRTRDLERLRYDAGETALLPLLDSERHLDDAEAALATTRLRATGDLVALIKSLGGGWAAEVGSAPLVAAP